MRQRRSRVMCGFSGLKSGNFKSNKPPSNGPAASLSPKESLDFASEYMRRLICNQVQDQTGTPRQDRRALNHAQVPRVPVVVRQAAPRRRQDVEVLRDGPLESTLV